LLKIRLVSTRSTYIPGKGKYPICPICKEIIRNDPDMHEALITKGMVRGHKKGLLINSQFNCVLRHNVCPDGQKHDPGVGSEEDYRKCLKHLIAFEGLQDITQWLVDMEKHFPTVARQALSRVHSTSSEVGGNVPIGTRGALWQEK